MTESSTGHSRLVDGSTVFDPDTKNRHQTRTSRSTPGPSRRSDPIFTFCGRTVPCSCPVPAVFTPTFVHAHTHAPLQLMCVHPCTCPYVRTAVSFGRWVSRVRPSRTYGHGCTTCTHTFRHTGHLCRFYSSVLSTFLLFPSSTLSSLPTHPPKDTVTPARCHDKKPVVTGKGTECPGPFHRLWSRYGARFLRDSTPIPFTKDRGGVPPWSLVSTGASLGDPTPRSRSGLPTGVGESGRNEVRVHFPVKRAYDKRTYDDGRVRD